MTPSFIGRMATMLPGAAEHLLRFLADRLDVVVDLVDRDDRRLAHDDAFVLCVHQRVRCPEIDRQIVREHREKRFHSHVGLSFP
jgi:hypothetical protein